MFDSGFSHRYPTRNGLHEDLIESRRVLIERDKDVENEYIPETLIYPRVIREGFTYHHLPGDARDLTSYIRLLKTEINAANIGRLLGHRLAGVNSAFGGTPSDTILPRFSVHSSQETYLKTFGGVDIKLLPPFQYLDGDLENATRMIESELHELRGGGEDYGDLIMSSIKSGINYVG